MQKIVFVINSLAGGGAERVFSCIVNHCRDRLGDRELVVALLDDEPAAYTLPDWVRVVRFDTKGGLVASARALRRLVCAERPTALLSFLTRSNLAAAYATRGTNIRWIASERVDTHAHLGTGLHGSISRTLVRIAYPRADAVVVVSRGVGNGLVRHFGVARDRITAIPNPVEAEEIARRAAEPPELSLPKSFVVAMGRLVPNKNFELLLRAYAKADIAPDLVLLGEGPLRDRLSALAADLGCAGRVAFPGFAGNPFAILARADCFVLSSNAEGFPNAMVEAMVCGQPVVATNCASGPSEILASLPREEISGTLDTDAGFIVPPNDVDAMAAALRRICAPDLRDRMADAAKARAAEFTVPRAVNAFWDVIDGVG